MNAQNWRGLTTAEQRALGAAACLVSTELSTGIPAETAARLRKHAMLLVVNAGLTPTELKNLGIDLIQEVTPASGKDQHDEPHRL